jgi:hypothetical protein
MEKGLGQGFSRVLKLLMSTITLTNIPHFVETLGRNITKTAGSLDRMIVPFVGPYYAAIPFSEGHPDTVYPLMFCTGWTEKKNGALKELTVNYAGRTDVLSGTFVSESLVSYSDSEKELSYTVLNAGETITQLYPGSGGGTTGQIINFKASLANYVLRYISRQVSFKYCSYPDAYIMPAGTGDQAPSVTSQYVRFAGSSAPANFSDASLLQQQYPGPFGFIGPIIREVSFKADQAIGGWYECSITYDARYEQ